MNLKIKQIPWLIKQSITLDVKFFCISRWHLTKKIDFLFIKYFLIIKHLFKKFILNESFCLFDKKKVFYDSSLGLVGYQSILCRHQKLIKSAKISNVHTIIDIGANVGFFSMLCSDLFSQSKIYSFEPIQETFQCLEKNLIGYANARAFNLAISDFTGKAKMNFNDQDSVVSQIADHGSVDVEVKKLDDIIVENKIDNIDILKIDTESFEAHVLRGGTEALKKTKYLFIEVNMETDNQNYTISSLFGLLSTENYDFQLVGFRNYNDVSEGRMRLMDALLINTKYGSI